MLLRGTMTMTMTMMVALTLATPALAAEVTVKLTGVKAKGGTVRVALYDEGTFLRSGAPFTATMTGASGDVTVVFKAVPAGDYAVAALHDADDDDKMAVGPDGRLTEGTAMSNAEKLRGPPTFAVTKVAVPASGLSLTLPMSYPEDRQDW